MDDVFKLDAVAKGAAGGNDRILELDAGKTDAQVGIASTIGGWRHWDVVYREGGFLLKYQEDRKSSTQHSARAVGRSEASKPQIAERGASVKARTQESKPVLSSHSQFSELSVNLKSPPIC